MYNVCVCVRNYLGKEKKWVSEWVNEKERGGGRRTGRKKERGRDKERKYKGEKKKRELVV